MPLHFLCVPLSLDAHQGSASVFLSKNTVSKITS